MNTAIAKSKYNDVPVATRPQSQALVEVENQRAMAEVQAAIVLAKKFPRDPIAAIDRIATACQRPGLAEQSLYSYARGGTDITGPSIRLAEAIAQNWGNLQYGIKELEQRNGESTVEAFAWDMETNVRQIKTFQVKHIRHTRQGSYALEDPRDIYEMVANQGARRLRACILGIIPGDVIDSAVNQCELTQKAQADTTPDALKKLVEAFAAYHITKEQIEKRIQRRLDTITPAQLIQLRKIYNSLKDGMSAAQDWFESTPDATSAPSDAAAALANKIKSAKQANGKKDNSKKESEKAPGEPSVAEQEGPDYSQGEAEPEPMAPKFCPDHPETTYTKAYCDACTKRQGCPVWV